MFWFIEEVDVQGIKHRYGEQGRKNQQETDQLCVKGLSL
jgi:hypothetical protein